MGKRQKKTAAWMVLLQGVFGAVILYLAGIALLAALLVQGTLPENGAFLYLAILCVLSVTIGGIISGKRTGWGSLPSALAIAFIFAGILLCVGGCWHGVLWSSQTAVLLLCALGGGLLAGVVGSRVRRKSKSRHRKKAL